MNSAFNTIKNLLDVIDAIDEAETVSLDRFDENDPEFQRNMANLHSLSQAIRDAKNYADLIRKDGKL